MEQPWVCEFGTRRLLRAFWINGVFEQVLRHFSGDWGVDSMSQDPSIY